MAFFDTELFIGEIEKHPAIWDVKSSDYANKIKKQKSSAEVAIYFYRNFEEESEGKKIEVQYLNAFSFSLTNATWPQLGLVLFHPFLSHN